MAAAASSADPRLFPAPKPSVAPKALIIILGSNFDSIQESQFKFMDELAQQGFDQDVFSISHEADAARLNSDPSIPKPGKAISKQIDAGAKKLNLHRVNTFLDEKYTVSTFVATPIAQYSRIILIDGIHYRDPSKPFLEARDWLTQAKSNQAQLHLLHFVSYLPSNLNPAINLSEEFDIFSLKVNLEKILQDAIKENIIDPVKHKAICTAFGMINKINNPNKNIAFNNLLTKTIQSSHPDILPKLKEIIHREVVACMGLNCLVDAASAHPIAVSGKKLKKENK